MTKLRYLHKDKEAIDMVGLRYSSIMEPEIDLFNLLVSDSATPQLLRMLGSESQATDFLDLSLEETEISAEKDKLGNWLDNFLRSYTELIVNEAFTPRLLIKMVACEKAFSKEHALQHGERYYQAPLRHTVLAVILATCPATIEKLHEILAAVTQDNDFLEDLLDEVLEVDTLTRIANLKASIKQELCSQPIDRDMLWYSKKMSEKLQEGLDHKLPKDSRDFLAVSKTYTYVPMVLKSRLASSSFWKRLPDLVRLMAAIGKWSFFIEAFLRCTYLHFACAVVDCSDVREETRAQVWACIDELLSALQKHGVASLGEVIEFEKRVDKYRNLSDVASTKKSFELSETNIVIIEKENVVSIQEENRKRVKELFDKRAAAILSKTKKRKQKFMESLAEETAVLAKQFSDHSSKSGLTCCLTQQPLTEQETYFQIGTLYPTNVRIANEAPSDR